LDAAAVEALLGEFFGEDDLGGDEDGGLAGLVRDGDFDEGPGVILLAALEAQAALGHVLALDDVIAAPGNADAGGVSDFDARVLAAIGARHGRRGGGLFSGGTRHGEDDGLRLALSVSSKLAARLSEGGGDGPDKVRTGGDSVSARIGAGGAKVGGR